MALYSGYDNNITLHRADGLVVRPSKDSRVVILEYEVHGKVLATGALYGNKFISVVTIENRKIIHWRDYGSTRSQPRLVACRASNASSSPCR
jgi:hypothetical protein